MGDFSLTVDSGAKDQDLPLKWTYYTLKAAIHDAKYLAKQNLKPVTVWVKCEEDRIDVAAIVKMEPKVLLYV